MPGTGRVARSGVPAPYAFALIDAAALLSHEQVEDAHLSELVEQIGRDGVLFRPVVVDRHSLVILDGHHRVLALRRLGCALVPAYLVDYFDSGIAVMPRRPEIPVSKDSVIATGLRGRLYPPKTSRHEWEYPLEERPVPLAVLTGSRRPWTVQDSAGA